MDEGNGKKLGKSQIRGNEKNESKINGGLRQKKDKKNGKRVMRSFCGSFVEFLCIELKCRGGGPA